MEEKIPHTAYTKWEEEKIKIKAEGEEISIDGFIKFYTNLINIEEKAQYIRKQGKPNEINKPVVRNMSSYYTTMKPPSHEQKRTNYGNRQNQSQKQNQSYGFKGKSRNPSYQTSVNRNVAQSIGNGGPLTPRYCIFCETNTHDTGFCKIAKYTTDYKFQ